MSPARASSCSRRSVSTRLYPAPLACCWLLAPAHFLCSVSPRRMRGRPRTRAWILSSHFLASTEHCLSRANIKQTKSDQIKPNLTFFFFAAAAACATDDNNQQTPPATQASRSSAARFGDHPPSATTTICSPQPIEPPRQFPGHWPRPLYETAVAAAVLAGVAVAVAMAWAAAVAVVVVGVVPPGGGPPLRLPAASSVPAEGG